MITTKPIEKLDHFDGGIKLTEHKQQSNQSAISNMQQSKHYIIPLQQHIGAPGLVLVKPGERVLKGQMLAKPSDLISSAIHSPVSGTVTKIDLHPVPHISGLQDQCIFIENDFQDEWIEKNPVADNYIQTSSHDLRNIIADAGIVGLGGATFPASVKQTEMNIKTLLLNGIECEPYISCDDVLMRDRAEQILLGAHIIAHIIKARQCIIAIEDNKPEAIEAMQVAINNDSTSFFQLQVVPTIYPSGGEKQLIKIISGKEVPKNHLPAELGILCHNVATTYAIYRAIYFDEPLISRITTVTGHGVERPQNIEVLIGTAMKDCIQHCGGYTQNSDKLIMGGPMMGFSIETDSVPIIKATNCLLITKTESTIEKNRETNIAADIKTKNAQQHLPCIRCGKCVDVCPARLLPQQLYWYASSQNTERLVEHNLFDCIECGCCAYVCPSDIPLVQYYRYAKTFIRQQERERKASDISRQRHESHQLRLEKQKQEREERLRKKRELLKSKNNKNSADDSKKAVIAEAIARAQAKKAKHLKDNNKGTG